MKKNIDILLISGGSENKATAEKINKLLKILRNITYNIHLVTFCNNTFIPSLNEKNIDSLKYYENRFKQFLYSQILVSGVIFSISRTNNIKIVLFAFGHDLQLVPMIFAKLLAKKTIIRSDGRPTVVLKKYFKNHSPLKRHFFKIIEEINYRLADIVLTESEYMILENVFQKYNSRNGSLFVNTDMFINKTDIHNRIYEIGFVGRLSQEKGILNFLESLELIIKKYNITIIGDAEGKNNVLSRIEKSTKNLNIKYISWIENEKLPNYLNMIKILVVPSYNEGLPNIVLEAMACGCVVLATSVGGIPGVIKDGETGFIMENNSPECIARNVTRALGFPNLCEIVKNARQIIEKDFTYKVAVERYKEILVI